MAELPSVESVFGRRPTPQSSRGIYGYRAGQEAEAAARAGEAISGAGADIQAEGENRKKERDDLELARAQSFALKEYAKLEQELADDPDPMKEKYDPLLAQRKVAVTSMVKDPVLAEKLGLALDDMGVRFNTNLLNKRRVLNTDKTRAAVVGDVEELKNVAIQAQVNGNVAQFNASMSIARNLIAKASAANPDAISAEQAGTMTRALDREVSLGVGKLMLDKDPTALKEMVSFKSSAGSVYGTRADGTQKGDGWLGPLKTKDGRVSTEISVGVEIDGKEVEIPTLVPTLSSDEVQYLLDGGEPSPAIVEKAVEHAKKRISDGKSPFKDSPPSPALGKQPLSVRNNNPGNLRGPDGEFLVFATKEEGLAAMRKDLAAKVSGRSGAMKRNYGENYQPTIRTLISTYAPTSENDTESYIATVSKATGIADDAILTESDIDKIMPAMIKVEGGAEASANFSDTTIEKTGTWVDGLDATDRISLMEMADNKIEAEFPKMIAKEIAFASPEQISEIATKYPERGEAFSKALSDRNKLIKADPVTYVTNDPGVLAARSNLELEDTQENRDAYYASLKGAQSNLGVPSYQQRVVPVSDTDELKNALSLSPTSDQMIGLVDDIRGRYGAYYSDAIRDIRNTDGIKPGFVELIDMPTDAIRNQFATALTIGDEQLKASVSSTNIKNFDNEVSDSMSDFQSAIMADGEGGARFVTQKVAAVKTLALSFMQDPSVSKSDAIERAKAAILRANVAGGMVIPLEFDPENVVRSVENFRPVIEDLNLLMPEGIAGDSNKERVHKETVLNRARPIVDDTDHVKFIDSTGNYLIDKDIAIFDQNGEITNLDAAIVSIPLSRASQYPNQFQTSRADQMDIVSQRAELSNSLGVDIKSMFSGGGFMSALGFDINGPDVPNFTRAKWTKEPSGVQKAMMLDPVLKKEMSENIRSNKKYFDYVLSKIPEADKPAFLELAKRSNQAYEEYDLALKNYKRSPWTTGRPNRMQLEDPAIKRLIAARKALSEGIGYNYIELPSWLPSED